MRIPGIYLLLLFVFTFEFVGAQTSVNEKFMRRAESAVSNLRNSEEKNEFQKHLLIYGDSAKMYKNTSLALRYYTEMIAECEKDSSLTDLCERGFIKMGDLYYDEGLPQKSIEYYQRASLENAPVLIKLASAYSLVPNLDSAVMFLNQALKIRPESGAYDFEKKILTNLSDLYQADGNWEKAMETEVRIQKLVELSGTEEEKAISNNNIGFIFHKTRNYEEALSRFRQVEDKMDVGKWVHLPSLFSNMGVAYFNLGDWKNAEFYFQKALSVLDKNEKDEWEGSLMNLMARVHLRQDDYYQALQYVKRAEYAAEKNKDVQVLEKVYETSAEVYQRLYDFEKSLDYFKRYLKINDSLQLEERLKQQKIVEQQILLERSEKEIRLLLASKELQDLAIQQLELEKEKLALASENMELEATKKQQAITLLKREKEIQKTQLLNQELEAKRARQELLLTAERLETAKKDKEIALLNEKEARQRLELAEKEAAEKQKEQQIELLTQEKKINELELAGIRSFKRFAYGMGAALLAIIGLILTGFLFARKTNFKLKAQKAEIEQQKDIISEERNKSDELLLNILPLATAKELKEKGKAEPKLYDDVSVLFADFTGFTSIAGKMNPDEVVSELNICFEAFDKIIEKYGLEKIKTIGDSYMVAGGVPQSLDGHAEKMVHAGVEMQQYLESRYALKKKEGNDYWRMRVGIHSGPVVAGVIGQKKFAYDIWGDTVNISSRLETACDPGQVNISESTQSRINGHFKVEPRGAIPVKGKGEMKMYFVK
ncbi:MAG: adenylate/guanylate cyclase domain-containing protein [Saprospiraceae bacterium]